MASVRHDYEMITSRQIRAARAMLGWSRQDLADRAIISISTVRRMEEGETNHRLNSIECTQKILEEAGIEFSFKGDDGVRLLPKL